MKKVTVFICLGAMVYVFANAGVVAFGDHLEPNDTHETATSLSGAVYISDLDLGNEDVDWFRWTATSEGVAYFSIYFESDHGDIDMALYDSDLDLLTSSTTSTDNEEILWGLIFEGDDFYLKVYPQLSMPSEGNTYNLEITGSATVPAPTTLLLLGSGLVGFAGTAIRKKFKK